MKTYSRIFKVNQKLATQSEQSNLSSCRLCFNIVSNSVPFDDLIKDKIKYCVGLEVAKSNGLPSNLCKRCFKKIENFYIFKKMCLSNDVKSQEFQVQKNVYREVSVTNHDCPTAKNLTLAHPTYKEDEKPISLLENTDETKSFLLEEDNIHPDAPDEVIYRLKKDAPTDIIDTQDTYEINLRENVKQELNIRESYEPVIRSRESLTGSYRCRECNDCFTRADRLILHEKQMHNIQRLYCNYCSKSFVSKALIERHMKSHTNCKPYSCKVCSKTFTQKESMIRHFSRFHCQKKFKCEKCSKIFKSCEELKSHCVIDHTAKRTNKLVYRYKCKFCSKSFCHSSGLSRHLLSHSGVISTCKICDKGFSDSSCLRRHLLAIHHRVASEND